MDILKFFSYFYDKTLLWSKHRHAPYYLAGVSFVESSFFPIPPDVMLISMGLAKPERSWRNAFIATMFSVLGGIFGYLIGKFGMHLIEPYLLASQYAQSYHTISSWFDYYGVWIIILAGFTPLPYKVFTITAGAMNMAFLPFVLGSIIGRGMRFFLVCGILYVWGAKIADHMRRYVDWIGWALVILIVLAVCMSKWM